MTKKDFERIADALCESKPFPGLVAYRQFLEQWRFDVRTIATALEASPKFKRTLWLADMAKKCGLDEI